MIALRSFQEKRMVFRRSRRKGGRPPHTAGKVSFEASTAPETRSIETTAGSITIRVPDIGYRIDTETTVGSISVDLGQEPDAKGP